MPRRRKSLQTLFIETFTFISLFALLGHFSVNFWERYVIQNELTKMKTSLHSLKETINDIGDAYDNLHRELKVLADFTEYKVETEIGQLLPDAKKPLTKDKSTIDKTPLRDVTVQAALVHVHDRKLHAKPETFNESTQKNIIKPPNANAGTVAKSQLEENFRKARDANVEAVSTFHEKKVQKSLTSKPLPYAGVNVSTITRYPLISTGTGMDDEDMNRKIHELCKSYCKYRDPRNHNACQEKYDAEHFRRQAWRF